MRPLLAGFIALAITAAVGTIVLSSGDPLAGAPSTESSNVVVPASTDPFFDGPESIVTVQGPDPRDAALRAVALNGELVTAGHFSRRDLIRSVATPELAEVLIADVSTQALEFQFEVNTSSDFEILQAPLTSRVESLGPERFAVTVWSVVVVSSAAFGVGRESWQTSTLELVLVEGAWLVDRWETEAGPAPAPSADLVFAGPGELNEPMTWTAVIESELG